MFALLPCSPQPGFWEESHELRHSTNGPSHIRNNCLLENPGIRLLFLHFGVVVRKSAAVSVKPVVTKVEAVGTVEE